MSEIPTFDFDPSSSLLDSDLPPPTPPSPPTTENETQAQEGKQHNLIDSNQEVEVKLISEQQSDPQSPLYSVKRFEELGLTKELLKGVYAMGFTKPSKIQERALPLLIAEP